VKPDQEFENWIPEFAPDPRVTPKADVAKILVEIVRRDGPILTHHACRLYVQAAGYRKMGKELRSALNKDMQSAINAGDVIQEREGKSTYFKDRVVHAKGTPGVIVRSKGKRQFSEIPISEVIQVLKLIKVRSYRLHGEALHREIMSFYDTKRLTHGISEHLDLIEKIAREEDGRGTDPQE